MSIQPANLRALNTDFRDTFMKAFRGAKTRHLEVATEMPSTTSKNTYGFIAEFPGMREWLGERVIHELEGKEVTVTNRDFEASHWIYENDAEDDNLGMWDNSVSMIGVNAAYHPTVLVYTEVKNSFTEAAYDGTTFFSNNHSWKDDSYSNKLALALDYENFGTARTLLRNNVEGGNSPLMGMEYEMTLFVGLNLETKAEEILLSDFNELMKTNTMKNKAKLVVNPQLTDNKWILAVTSLPIKPWLFQRRSNLRFMSPEDFPEERSKRKRLVWGVDYRAAAGKTLWQLAVGSDPGE